MSQLHSQALSTGRAASETVALFTQRRQFSAVVCSHRAEHLQCKDEAVSNSHRKPLPRILKRRGGPRHNDDVCVFLKVLSQCLPVNLTMYPLTVYNHMDAVIMC